MEQHHNVLCGLAFALSHVIADVFYHGCQGGYNCMDGSKSPQKCEPAGLPRLTYGLVRTLGSMAQKSPDTPGSPEGNTEGPGTASSEPLLPS